MSRPVRRWLYVSVRADVENFCATRLFIFSLGSIPALDEPNQMSNDKTSPSPDSQEDSGFVPGDDFTAQWINYFRLVFGRMTDDGERQWKKARDLRKEATDCAKCEKHRDYLLNYSRRRVLK